jgi:DNA-binding response OmpR family regulator
MEQKPCIEIIDDDRAWRESLADYLRSKGFRVLLAGNAEQGLRILRLGSVTAVVCDYHLPGEDGLKLVKRIRALPLDVTIVMASSDDEPGLRGRAMAAGVQAFLDKITAPHTLLKFLQRTRQAQEGTNWHRLSANLAASPPRPVSQ